MNPASNHAAVGTSLSVGMGRKRKAHHKSRRGCGNCKVRRVKCDETHPKCRKCIAYGVACDFTDDLGPSNARHNQGEMILELSNDAPFQIVEFSLSNAASNSESTASISEPSTKSSSSGIDSDSDTSNRADSVLVSSDNEELTISQPRIQSNNYKTSRLQHGWIGHQTHNGSSQYFPTPSLRLASPSISHTLLAMFDFNSDLTHSSSKSFQPGLQTLQILDRYQSRTALTIGSATTWNAFRKDIMGLVWSHEHLLHVVITLTLMHDRFLADQNRPNELEKPRTDVEEQAYHWYRGTHMFNRILSRAITARSRLKTFESAKSEVGLQASEDKLFYNRVRPSLWPCAAILGAVVFNDTDFGRSSRSSWDVWPLNSYLKPTDHEETSHDLEWLKMSEGKHVVWNLATPLSGGTPLDEVEAYQPEDVQQVMKAMQNDLRLVKEGKFGLDDLQDLNKRLPNGLGELFFSSAILSSSASFQVRMGNADGTTSDPKPSIPSDYTLDCFRKISAKDDASVYLPPLIILSHVLPRLCTHATVLPFLNFIYQLSPPFIALLREKDPRAMFLLALWYAKLAEYGSWWVVDRAVREGRGICIWLDLTANHQDTTTNENEPNTVVPNEKEQSQQARGPQVSWALQIVTSQKTLLAWVREQCR